MPNLRLVEGDQPDEFHIPASDTKGHSARQWFRCIPVMARQVEQVVQSGQWPYRTKGDLLRHALHRHMRWLQSEKPISTISSQVDAILEIMRDEEMNNDFNLVFSKLDERISNHLSSGENREAMRLLLVIRNHINGMPNGFWKKKYQGRITDKYGKLIGGVEKASMSLVEED